MGNSNIMAHGLIVDDLNGVRDFARIFVADPAKKHLLLVGLTVQSTKDGLFIGDYEVLRGMTVINWLPKKGRKREAGHENQA